MANCSSGGSAESTLVRDKTYLLQIFDEETWLCFGATASTCASGGRRYTAGFAGKITINGDMLKTSCRSAASSGDAELTLLEE